LQAKEVAALANSEGCIVKLPRHTNNVDQPWFYQKRKVQLMNKENNKMIILIFFIKFTINSQYYEKLKEWSK
jgi:hypothetical protein